LRENGHDVLTAAEAGLSQAEDGDLLRFAAGATRGLLSRDKGFGNLVFQEGLPNNGIVLLRITPSTQRAVHAQFLNALTKQPDLPCPSTVLVVEPHRYRIRRGPL
jgi:predicted nuclease of predicted toxin-antitoxin system